MQIQTQGWLLSREVTQTPYGLMKVLEHFGIVVPLDSIASAIKIYNERGGVRTLAVIINDVMIVIREWNGKEKHGKVVFGALGIGGLKMKIHRACVARLFEQNDLVLDAERIFSVAREIGG